MTPLGRLLEDRIEQSAQVVSLFANGTRLEILYLLAEGDCSVGELVAGTGCSFSSISWMIPLMSPRL
ncbi:MAG: ArsR family transcriptional regulator [Spirochaetota bacterium]